MSFNRRTTTQQWMKFLKKMDEVSSTFQHSPKICSKVTMFRSAVSKRLWVQVGKTETSNGEETGKMTSDEAAALIASWTQGLTIGSFLKLIQKSGVMAIFTNPLGNAVEQQAEKVVSWHTYVIYFQDGILGVYDPNFTADTTRFDACRGVPLVKELVKALRGRGTNRRITEVWFGGGGNRGTRCQEMTRKWIEYELVIPRGEDLGKWNGRKGWVKVRY